MTIDDRLNNWSRFFRTRLQRQCCASMEGKLYHAPWRQWVELSDIQHSTVIDWRDAEEVESAWRHMIGTPKLILKYTYMANFPDHVVCRKAGVKRYHLEAELIHAKKIIVDILSASCYNTTYNLKPQNTRERFSPKEADSLRPKQAA